MVFARLVNSRSFRIVEKLTCLTAQRSQVAKRFLREIPRKVESHDLSLSTCITWILLGGIPTVGVGIYIAMNITSLIDDFQAGLIAPGSGPGTRLTNDQWLQLKQQVNANIDDDEEDADTEVQDEEAEKNVECIDESDEELSCKPPVRDVVYDFGKDKVLFTQKPSQQ